MLLTHPGQGSHTLLLPRGFTVRICGEFNKKVIKRQAGRVHRVSRFGICCQVLRGPPHVHGPLPLALSLWPASIYTLLGLSPSEPELLM